MFEQQERENPTFFHEPFKRLDALQGAYGMDCVITNSIPMKIPISLSRLTEICCLRNNVTPYFPWPLTNNTFLRKLSQLSNALDLSRAIKPHHLYFISYGASLEENSIRVSDIMKTFLFVIKWNFANGNSKPKLMRTTIQHFACSSHFYQSTHDHRSRSVSPRKADTRHPSTALLDDMDVHDEENNCCKLNQTHL